MNGRSTILQLLHIREVWADTLDEGGTLEVCYMDFIAHKRILASILIYGIEGNSGLLDSKQQRVIVNGITLTGGGMPAVSLRSLSWGHFCLSYTSLMYPTAPTHKYLFLWMVLRSSTIWRTMMTTEYSRMTSSDYHVHRWPPAPTPPTPTPQKQYSYVLSRPNIGMEPKSMVLLSVMHYSPRGTDRVWYNNNFNSNCNGWKTKYFALSLLQLGKVPKSQLFECVCHISFSSSKAYI